MPEIVLSYDCAGFFEHPEDWSDPAYITPIEYLYNVADVVGGQTLLRDHKTGLNIQRIKGNNKNYCLMKIDISSDSLLQKTPVFKRLDGNHRLVALEQLASYVNPDEYVIFNKTTITCFNYLDIPDMPKYNYQYTGKKYVEVCKIAKEISALLSKNGVADTNLLAVDYFMWDELLPLAEQNPSAPLKLHEEAKPTAKATKSIHNELIEKLVTIGELLGFDSRSEVRIATGAIVDAVWEAKIGNMGKAIYVFEVQSGGSIDSLILNLKKAQSNAAVQAVVAVSDELQIEKIKAESKGVIDEKSLRTWDTDDVLAVYDSLTRAHESINKLALVPESF